MVNLIFGSKETRRGSPVGSNTELFVLGGKYWSPKSGLPVRTDLEGNATQATVCQEARTMLFGMLPNPYGLKQYVKYLPSNSKPPSRSVGNCYCFSIRGGIIQFGSWIFGLSVSTGGVFIITCPSSLKLKPTEPEQLA